MFKETRIQGVQGVQDNSLLAPKSIRQVGCQGNQVLS